MKRIVGMLGTVLVLVSLSTGLANAQGESRAGTVGRIAKFVTATTLSNSVLFESAGKIGLGTTAPITTLDVRGNVNLWTAMPYLYFRDTSAANSRSYIRASNGGLGIFGEDYVNASNPSAFVQMDRDGRVGIGTSTPQRTIQIGADTNALFTVESSWNSPWAGAIRFGDKTGWGLIIGRSRESSGGPLNTGSQGALIFLRDDGAFQMLNFPFGAVGITPLCITNGHYVTPCQSSSLRYKRDIKPYAGGLDVVDRLRPIAFTRKLTGTNDIGFAAEDVEQIDPRLTYDNEEGEVEGVRYELLTTILVNAIKEQQEQIEELKSAVARLEAGQPN